MKLQDLVRPNIWNLQPYSSARHEFEGEAEVYLDANENPYGAAFSRYPDPLQGELKKVISAYKNISNQKIFLGNGSDEAIDLLIRIFCTPGQDEILVLPPTYGMYKVCADIADVRVNECLLTKDYQLDVQNIRRVLTSRTKLLFICSPNNPTGNLINHEQVSEVLQFFKGILVLDEAYIDFAEEGSWLTRLDDHPNLVILQTFSKAWGLAGIRLGLAFAPKAIIDLMNKVKPPYNINLLTQQAALQAIKDHVQDKNDQVDEIIFEKTRLAAILNDRPEVLKVYESDANFLLVKFVDPIGVFKHLRADGIVVRDRTKTPLCQGCLRITIGTPHENNLVIKSLNELN
ncbi:MAG: histidinol-phosphate transaminase [Saprospiraceae bacterium]|nr:histidinol-phosphate transaminase [Saprospiraceae bacterium]